MPTEPCGNRDPPARPDVSADQHDPTARISTGPSLEPEVDHDVVTKMSPWSRVDTLSRLLAVVAARGMEVVAVVHQDVSARHAGLKLQGATVVLLGRALVHRKPHQAADLPRPIVIWEDEFHTLVSYQAPAAGERPYESDGAAADARSSIETVISVVIDR